MSIILALITLAGFLELGARDSFVAETRFLAEKRYFLRKNKLTSLLFFLNSPPVLQKVWKSRRERMRVGCQQNRALMELSSVDICIFQAISMTEVYGCFCLVKKVC